MNMAFFVRIVQLGNVRLELRADREYLAALAFGQRLPWGNACSTPDR